MFFQVLKSKPKLKLLAEEKEKNYFATYFVTKKECVLRNPPKIQGVF